MSDKYVLLMYYVHSYLESVRNELIISKDTTVENFRDIPENQAHCVKVFENCLNDWNYELSYNQIANGINLLIKSWSKNNFVLADCSGHICPSCDSKMEFASVNLTCTKCHTMLRNA